MNKPVLITEVAKDDILNITEYIAKDNKKLSISIVSDFYKTFELISNFPEAGSLKNGILDKTIRIYTVRKSFAIVYRITDKEIEILRILTRYQNIFAVLN